MKNLTKPGRQTVSGRQQKLIQLSPLQMEVPAHDVLARARQNKALAQFLTGRTVAGLKLSDEVMKYYDEVIAGLGNATLQEERKKLMEKVAQKDPVAARTMASIRIETMSNYLYAPANFVSLYGNIVNLRADERPVAQRITMQEVGVYAVGGDGAPSMVKINLEPDETLVPMGWLTSDIFRYRKIDIYHGRIVDAQLATVKVAYDVGQYENEQVKALLGIGSGTYAFPSTTSTAGQAFPTTFFGPFTFTGKRANWTYVAHSTVDVANLPTTNNVTVYEQDGTTRTTKFGFQVLAYIMDYCSRWDGAFQDGVNLRPTGRILLPPQYIKDISNGIFPSGATRNKIADELMEQGWFGIHYLGIDWLFQPDNTLSPNNKVCYPEFNKKPLTIYHKPDLDEEKTSEGDYQLESKNEEERYMRKAFGAYWDSSRRAWAARFWFDGNLHN